mmetsp:Transcript_104382/g.196474  ORF Transcript_104382/g.196474 Transcript_104382/m.196474 type:complete len:632 (+) Transcript_104382:86-1981(+)
MGCCEATAVAAVDVEEKRPDNTGDEKVFGPSGVHIGTAFSSKAGSAGLMDGDPPEDFYKGGLALFIIDPQIDFHEGGPLGVPGAKEDSKRIVDVINKHMNVIERIVVTLDTHHPMHIHHQYFWADKDGKHPDPMTIISVKDVVDKKWIPRQKELEEWVLFYVKKLEAGGQFPMIIWPTHCLLGTKGHAVYEPLMETLNKWAIARKRSINWYFKGQNNRAEMYSALKAEVEVPDDMTTSIDKDLIATLAKHEKVICCGEALSHCVNWSTRHLLSGFPAGRAGDIIVLEDAASTVPGFEEAAGTFIKDMKAAGVTVCKAADVAKLSVKPVSSQPGLVRANSRPRLGRSTTGFGSKAGSAGLMDGVPVKDVYSGGAVLFIIDPQNDFHEGGNLGVPGATADSARIIKVIEKFKDKIERIVVTLDTHHAMHIHHQFFWADKDGKHPDPLSIISKADIAAGKWKARQTEMQAWAEEYVTKLEATNYPMCIWPTHCLLGTTGHALHEPLMNALNKWAIDRARCINWYFKGQNNRAEMYSALKAEVEVADDPTTSFDVDLVATLAKHNKVVCCGEALSHCVNFSVRHLLSGWKKSPADIVLLEDAATAVPSFEQNATDFVSDMRKAGVTVCKAEALSL